MYMVPLRKLIFNCSELPGITIRTHRDLTLEYNLREYTLELLFIHFSFDIFALDCDLLNIPSSFLVFSRHS